MAPFAKAGLLFWEEETFILFGQRQHLAEGTDPVFGAGIEVDLLTRFGARAEWARYEFDGATADSVTASMLVRFRQ